MKCLLTVLLSLFVSFGAIASDEGESAPLVRKMVDYSSIEQAVNNVPPVIVMSEAASVRTISYKIAECAGRSVAVWNYGYPECCLKKCGFDHSISKDDPDDLRSGAGAMFQGFSIYSCVLTSIVEAGSAICCTVCGYGECCYNSTQFCVCLTNGCCVCGNAGCLTMAGNMGIAAGASLCGALCCYCSILGCRAAITCGVLACDSRCTHCAEGLVTGHREKQEQIMAVFQGQENATPPAQITMGYQSTAI
jgi:hypothetical protein